MLRRFIPAYCAQCGAAVPRAAAGRCPSCRVEFAPANTGVPVALRTTAAGQPGPDKGANAAPRLPRQLP